MNSTLQAVPKALYHETVLKKHRNNIALNTIATLFASLSDIEPCQVDGLRDSQVQTRRKKNGLQFCSVYIWERKWALPLSSGLIVRISHPVFVTSKVCSNWAERFPSCNEPEASLNTKKNKLTTNQKQELQWVSCDWRLPDTPPAQTATSHRTPPTPDETHKIQSRGKVAKKNIVLL